MASSRRIVQVVAGQIPEQLANQQQAVAVVVGRKVRHAARGVVRHGAAELFLGHLFVRDGLEHVGTGHEHVAAVPDHHREVGDRRRVHGAAGARAHDGGNLRHDARGEGVPEKDVGVAGEREHALLNPRAPGIVQPHDRRSQLHRQIHDLHDLRRVGFRQRSAEDREILREGKHLASVHEAMTGDDAVAGNQLLVHPEIAAAVGDELVDFFERAGVEQELDALARGELAGGVLLVKTRLAAAQLGAAFEVREDVVGQDGHAGSGLAATSLRLAPPATSPSP